MGQGQSGLPGKGMPGDGKDDRKEKKKYEPAAPPSRVGRKQRKAKGPEAAARLPVVTPATKCKLRLLKLERVKDYLLMEEEYVTNQERLKPQEEKNEEDRSKVDDLRGTPMSVGSLEEIIDENHAIVSSSVGPEYYVSILSFVDKDQLEPGCSILMHNKVLSVVGILQDEVDPMVSVMKVEKAPLESYADVGGLEQQIQEIKEAVELPLTHPELYEDIGIKPPKGVILYGEPGTGKTLLAKAVANSTSATFLRVVGSELIQKYLGDGPKLVRELFRVADDLSPSIVFIDEIDAVGTKRYDAHSGGEREIQRTMLELLNQLDGFDSRGDVKVILATNRIDSLDPALLRPGRIDRKIEFPLPDIKTKRRIFQIHTSRMTTAEDVNLEEFVLSKDELSGADIKAMCTEAGLLALRERRMKVTQADFRKAKEKVLYKKKEGVPEAIERAVREVEAATRVRIVLRMANASDSDPFQAEAAALQLLLTAPHPDVLLGPPTSLQASIVGPIASAVQVPLLSYAASDPLLNANAQLPYFVRMHYDDQAQMTAVSDIISYYNWTQVVALFESTDSAWNGFQTLTRLLQQRGTARVVASWQFDSGVSAVEDVMKALLQVRSVEASVFVLHLQNEPTIRLLLKTASQLGLFTEGYVWIATAGVMSLLAAEPRLSSTQASCEGMIGTLPFDVPTPHREETVKAISGVAKLTPSLLLSKAEGYRQALYAYDAVKLFASAHLDTLLHPPAPPPPPSPSAPSQGNSSSSPAPPAPPAAASGGVIEGFQQLQIRQGGSMKQCDFYF
ncbi:unnamed protein product [Closterium sp. NIES-53]